MAKVDAYPTTTSTPADARQVTSTDFPSESKTLLDVAVKEGNFVFTGLENAILVTTLDVGTTPTLLPLVALTDRKALSVHNTDGAKTLYIGTASVTADNVVGVTSGHEVGPGQRFNLDITDGNVIFGITTATTVRVKVTELS